LGQIQTVREVIAQVEASNIDELIVFNKADLIDADTEVRLRGLIPGCLLVSARDGRGIDELETAIADRLPKPDEKFEGVVPYDRGDLVSRVHLSGTVLEIEYVEEGTRLVALVSHDLASELRSAKRS
jgi:GTP-binding protein HflX